MIARLNRISPVWFLSGALAVLAVAIVPFAIVYDAPTTEPRLAWPIVALGFYLAEIAVLHLRFRRDAQSFSMSEIAITVGLFFATPTAMLIGQFVGNAVALILNRRQPPMKLVFNLAQFTVQIGAAIIAFNLVLGDGDPFSPRGWIAALAGNLAAFAVSDLSVNTAIKMAGGSLSRGEAWTVRWLTTGAAFMNTILGVVIVLVWSTQPAAAILALAPPVMLYLAYLAYTLQRGQQARVEALQRTAQALLRAHTLTDVASLAAEQARAMFEAELAEVAIMPSDDRPGLRGIAVATEDVDVRTGAESPGRVKRGEALLLKGSALQPYLVSDAVTPVTGMVASIDGEDGAVGFVVVVNPLSDVASYDTSDLALLETLSGQIGPIIENERLGGEVAALAELVDSRNQVLAAVSHEVRSPLATVVSAAATLEGRMADLSPENRKVLVDLIRKNSQELTAIVDDLLVAARWRLCHGVDRDTTGRSRLRGRRARGDARGPARRDGRERERQPGPGRPDPVPSDHAKPLDQRHPVRRRVDLDRVGGRPGIGVHLGVRRRDGGSRGAVQEDLRAVRVGARQERTAASARAGARHLPAPRPVDGRRRHLRTSR